MEGIQLRVSDLVYAIKKRWTLILALTAAGLIIGIGLAGASYLQGRMTKSYEVNASALFITETSSGSFTLEKKNPDISDYRMAGEMSEAIRYVMKSDKLINRVIEKNELIGITVADIASNLKVSGYSDTPIMTFSITWRSADEGVSILDTLLKEAPSVLKETFKLGTLSVINEPSAKYIVGGSINAPIWGIMMVLGLAAGIGIAVLEILLRPTIINIKDIPVEIGVDTLGVIPKNNNYFEKNLNLLEDGDSIVSDVKQDYSALAYILRNRLGSKKEHHVFYVTSAIRGEGRSSAAAHLAVQLSDMEHKVLLIDFDTRNPHLSSMFLSNIDYEHSLNALYRGEINEKEAITSLTGYLDILPVVLEHVPIPVDNTVFDLVKRLSENYDYVIMDTAPVGEIADTLSLNQVADASLLVIGFDMATKPEIKDTVDKMEKSGIHVIGCLVNKEKTIETSLLFTKESDKKSKKKGKKKPMIVHMNAFATVDEMTSAKAAKASDVKPENQERNSEDIGETPVSSKVLTDEEAINGLLKLGFEKKDEGTGDDL